MASNSGFAVGEVFDKLSSLSDEAVITSLCVVLGRRRQADALVIAHLSEVQERRLHLARGYSSLTNYCVERLGMSEDQAGLRVAVAHLVRRLPEALACLADGRVHLSGLLCLKPHLTSSNAAALLARASGKTKREIKELVASLAPMPDARPLVRREAGSRPGPDRMEPLGPSPRVQASAPNSLPNSVPDAALVSVSDAGPTADSASAAASGSDAGSAAASVPDSDSDSGSAADTSPLPAPAFTLEPPAPSRYRVQFTASATLSDKLRRLQARMGRGVNADSLAHVIEAAVDAKLAELDKRQYAKTDRPRKTVAGSDLSPTSRAIPAAVRRAVVERDGEQCSCVAAPKHGGHRCTETRGLEFHHRVPFARGGDHSVDNVHLLCRAHNLYEAEQDYGRDVMDRYSSRTTGEGGLTPDPAQNRSPKSCAGDPVRNRSAGSCTPDPVQNRSSSAREAAGEYEGGFGRSELRESRAQGRTRPRTQDRIHGRDRTEPVAATMTVVRGLRGQLTARSHRYADR